MAVVFLARIQHGLYPVLLVGAVGILLTLQANTDVLGIGATLVLDIWLVADALEVAAIDLNTRFVGVHLHEDACYGTVEACTYDGVVALAVLIGVQTPVVVVTTSVLNLVELRLDAIANGVSLAEIHRSTLHGLNLACGDVQLVRRSEVSPFRL